MRAKRSLSVAEPTAKAVSELLRERVRLDDELARHHQALTVLFVDIVGSTRFYEQHGDVAGLAMVQTFLDKLVPIVEQHKGTVVKTMGDAILARFQDALPAVFCALNMQWTLLERNEGRSSVDQIHIRVAINSGFALIQGTDVFGDVVNVCSRIESCAQPDEVLISPSVYDQICQHEEIAVRKRVEGVLLKGKSEKLDLYEVVWRFGTPVGPAPPPPSPSQIAMSVQSQPADAHSTVGGETLKTPADKRRKWPNRSQIAYIGSTLVLLILAATAAVLWQSPPQKTAPRPPSETTIASVAVLPFVDMSPNKNEEYFSDGLSEELLNELAKVPQLKVAGRTSSFQFKGKNVDLRTIGETLGVGAVLEGSVRKEGNRVRITVQLVKAADGFHLWSEAYDRELTDIFGVQEEIARSVRRSLKVALLGSRPPASSTVGKNANAFNAYLQGRYFLDRRTKEDIARAVGFYQDAIKDDANYAAAWAGLSMARSMQAGWGYAPLAETYKDAREAARRALELDAHLPEAHLAVGRVQQHYDWDWEAADKSYRTALNLAPNNVVVLAAAASLAFTLGRLEEAMELDRQAADLDRVRAGTHMHLGLHAYYAGRYDEAIAALHTAIELNPQYPGGHMLLGRVYLAQAHPQAALDEMNLEAEGYWRSFGQALAFHALGRKTQSDQCLGEFIKSQPSGSFQVAEVYAYRGDAGHAFEWLERAYTQRDGGVQMLKNDPLLKNLENDPRYAVFLRKLHLPI